ncbi:MAG: hypothetical protein LBQ15_11580 [Clostridium sp.]|jgi:hypothetical protein|nr:hypothetical protein [Clostridium sp.]
MIKKTLWIVPYVILLSVSEIFLSTREAQPLSDVLWYSIFGRLRAGDVQTLVLSVKSIGILFLFALLFGNSLSDYFGSNSMIIFTRVNNRRRWSVRKILALCGLSFVYTGFLLLLKFLIGIRRVKAWSLDPFTIQTLVTLLGMILPLLVTICLLVNWVSIGHGAAIAIFSVFVAVILLELIAILGYDHTAMILFNPLCFSVIVLSTPKLGFLKILVGLFYLILVSLGTIFHMEHMDIF